MHGWPRCWSASDMTCPAIATGSGFLSGVMAHVDCQARMIGSYGYGALADTSSPVFVALTGLLTIFIALHGVRLLLGAFEGSAGIIGGVVKVGIVLTLATSWPAWRVIGYDLILDGPAELARIIGSASGLADQVPDIVARLQGVDDGIVAVTSYGTGRLTGGVAAGNALGDSFNGIALADQFALGMGRAAFLAGTLVPFGILRLGAGILLALAPLMAGLLLFGGTNGIFYGWARGLAFCALGSLIQMLVQGVELALIEPWLGSVLDGRQSGAFTPSAPTELFVLSLAFAGVSIGLLLLCGRFVFFRSLGQFSDLWRISDILTIPAEPVPYDINRSYSRNDETEFGRPQAADGKTERHSAVLPGTEPARGSGSSPFRLPELSSNGRATAPSGTASPPIIFDASGSRSGIATNAGNPTNTDERVTATWFQNPSTTIPKGTVIQAVLESALDSTRAGFARAIVSRDVFGFDGTQVLIPRGSRLVGEYKADLTSGQNRALIQWQRLMRPDGAMINLDSPSADPLGRAGVKGKVNSHFLERFGGAILQSALDIGVQLATRSVSRDAVIVALPGSVQGVTAVTPDKVQPTLKVRQGASVSVFVSRDLDFSTVAQ